MIALVLGVLAVALAAGLAAPRTADAYLGENLVETVPGGGVGDELTGPAKSILERPTFLPETTSDAAAAVGADEAAGVAGVAEAAGALPLLGSVAAFTAGAGIGSLICNSVLELEGCWGYHTDSTNPSPGVSGSWVFRTEPLSGSEGLPGVQAFTWVWSEGQAATWRGFGGVPSKECGLEPPGGGHLGARFYSSCKTVPKVEAGAMVRSPFANQSLEGFTKSQAEASGYGKYTGSNYCPTESPTGCKSTPPSNWSERMARGLHSKAGNITEATRGKLGQSIAAAIPGSGVKYPYKTYVKVPSCAGLSQASCLKELEELDLSPKVTELDWDEAVIEELNELEPEKTREEEAERVIELTPAAPTEVVIGTEIDVVTNPDEEDMPKWVPLPPPDGADEDADEFQKKRRIIAPLWLPSVTELDDAALDPEKGPGAVVRTTPRPGQGSSPDGRLDPHTETELHIYTNPDSAPDATPGAGGGGWTPPVIPAIDMSPLSGFSPCGVFPFGLFCWLGDALGQFNTTGSCPEFSAPVAGTGSNFEVTLCGETSETIMDYLRPAILLAFTVGLGFLFARGTKAIGDD